MKREALSELHGYNSDGDVRLAKARQRESPITNPELWKKEHKHSKAQQPLSPFSPDYDSKQPDPLEYRTTTPASLTNTTNELLDNIYHWIPTPSETNTLEVMSQPTSKRSRSRSISTDQGRAQSVSSDNSESSSAQDTRSYTYRAVNYITILETKGCFIQQSSTGPISEDIALYKRLLSQPIEPPTGTLLEDKYSTDFHNALQNRSEALREDIDFPYLTAEIKYKNQALELADRQNIHSMYIALRAVVSLCQAADCTEEVHRRILGFSISHELEGFRIYGYYPEINDGKVSFYRWPVAQPNVWVKETRWTCYQFVENLDRDFLPIHTDRLIRILEEVPDPDEDVYSIDVDELDSQVSMVGLQERPGYRRAASSQNRGLQPELRMMVQTLQQQLAEQKGREEKREAEQKKREAEQKLREERREVEQKDREKKREADYKELQDKLLALLEQRR
ncbi:hypothetical protein CBS147333_9340 [Penicillium roqueforti]|nr:hypothetical protein CBS147354_9557 [Penicillium roqueforti]KAI2737776.1 hypothetical protein DTO013F2_9733 [Penicillium roqueforti]KAI3097353.1 hypothetical protein CBS147333_9340 [Penicillium roqueforti]KAI3122129.1 hypothetical protein CBS147326_8956 [Penicillium roqueforti]KAI3192808.1 hypothetical protein CBS147311_9033 [Penicillium roqueforti]